MIVRKSCAICGKEFVALSHSDVNSALVEHGMAEHQAELKRADVDQDPIAVSDYISGEST